LSSLTLGAGAVVSVVVGVFVWLALGPPQISSTGSASTDELGRAIIEPFLRGFGRFPFLALPALVIGVLIAGHGIWCLRASVHVRPGGSEDCRDASAEKLEGRASPPQTTIPISEEERGASQP
jgi:hypothetical protein